MDKVRIAIVGCGNISQLTVPGYLEHPNCEVYALCDTVPGRAESRARQWGISPKTYTDFDQVLNDSNVDAVELLVPHHLHLPMTVGALEVGKHVSCQKPMSGSISEADQIIEAASKATATFRVTENYLYYPPILKAKELLDSGEIGEPSLVRFHSVGGGGVENPQLTMNSDAGVWRQDSAINPMGLIWDDGVHKFATAMKWVGDIEQVFGIVTESSDKKSELGSVTVWKFKGSDCLGIYDLVNSPQMIVRGKYYPVDDYMEIYGSKGAIHVTRCTGEMLDLPPVLLVKGNETESFDVPSDYIEGFNGANNDFIDSIIEGRQPDMDAEFGKKTVQVALAIYEAARTQRTAHPGAMVSTRSP